ATKYARSTRRCASRTRPGPNGISTLISCHERPSECQLQRKNVSGTDKNRCPLNTLSFFPCFPAGVTYAIIDPSSKEKISWTKTEAKHWRRRFPRLKSSLAKARSCGWV